MCTLPPPRAPWEAAPAIGAPGTSGLRPWQAEVPPAGTQLCPLQKQSPHLRRRAFLSQTRERWLILTCALSSH